MDGLILEIMAAATASQLNQDVSFQTFQQKESSLEELDTEVKKSVETRDDVIVNIADTEIESEIKTEQNDSPPQTTGGKFKLGIDDGNEFMDELTFSLQHCALPPGQVQEGGVRAAGEDNVEGQPPPGHWVSQPHGELFCIVLTRTTQESNLSSLYLIYLKLICFS